MNNKQIKNLKEISVLPLKVKLLIALKYGFLIGLTIVFLIPLVWTLSGSFKPSGRIFTLPIQWIPATFHWENYANLLDRFPFFRFALNSLVLVGFNMVFTIISSLLVAYGFARFRHPWNQKLFIFVLATMMIPPQVTLIPQFLIFSKLGWVDSYLPLIVPNLFGNAFNIFLMRQFIMGIPRSLDESAYMDGANSFKILTKIIVPLCMPVIITIGVFTFNSNWNDFMGPLIYLSTQAKYPLQLALYTLDAGRQGITDFGMLFAASIVALIPPMFLFVFLQKHVMAGIKIGGSIKG
ncbi:multiple sugar transport system permease protein [Amphibacillus marinus]|uniref:Multiple sugar transport system permease protein n=1 Tax=Amphibacillus marinus TaxID=872970 RepID=A0A1H8T9U9_9BACI|nr:carbohydrate ABC transporter permease [Amphibacillus marinus]SEO87919.1 multiple sugar transport system permease protein [Amphibacillus marinus]